MASNYKNKFADAVFEGGGVKGIGLIGAMKVMEDDGYEWRNVAGTSAGAIVASLVSAGYNAIELKEIIENINYKDMLGNGKKNNCMLGKANNLIFKKGIYKSDYLKQFVNGLLYDKLKNKLENRKQVKFKDLIIPGKKGILLNNPKYKRKYKLHIIATDITKGKMLILPEDIADYGLNPDELDVSLAVRMSISIPFFFQPIILKSAVTREKSLIVDGGVLSNYPVWLFDVNGVPNYPTIGFKLGASDEKARLNKTNNIFNMGAAVISTMLEAQDDVHIAEMEYLRSIKINTLNVKATDFDISKGKVEELYLSGENCARRFLEVMNPNYEKYIEYRKKNTLSV
ncbi:patatin-like phospholipase family protein [Clostridium grantii]|uniref:NTE family protein n=1 Tax=Clostridium grantii DSM 8605 TaxID=1121316 RepID=A0A1M5S4G6_9CLOT|nr:patatin-like phospholipase family protein [Clostridium grantii]SHH33376.1 NTE family protein [Clostridium grantii DSM 8605]